MFEFFQNQHNNEALIEKAKQIEAKFEKYLEDGHYYDRLLDLLNHNMPEDDNDDTPYWTKNNDGHYSEKREGWFDGLPRKLRPEDYVKKARYSDSEFQRLKCIAMVGDDLDDNLINDNKFTEEYKNLVRKYFNAVAEVVASAGLSDEARKKGYRVQELVSSWLGSITELMQPLRTLCLFYIDYTVRQTRMLLELYQTDASKEELTQRHLFRVGLKRLELSDIDFMGVLYSIPKMIADYATVPFYSMFWELLKHQVTRVRWITNPQIVKEIRAELFDGFPFAESAYRKGPHKNDWKNVLKPYTIYFNKYSCKNINGRFRLKGDFNGFVGYKENPKNGKKEIIVGFAGTESKENWKTDLRQFFGKLPIAYVQAFDLVESIWAGTRHKNGFKKVCIKVYGHSLGGGLMQYAISKSSADNIIGFGYNSAGLSLKRHRHRKVQKKQIYHLYNPCDIVFIFPTTVQLGGSIKFDKKTFRPIKAHSLDAIKKKIDLCKKGKISISKMK